MDEIKALLKFLTGVGTVARLLLWLLNLAGM